MKPRHLNVTVDGQRYRTVLSYLLADDGEATYLFRAHNSNFFVQRDGPMSVIDTIAQAQAESLYHQMENKYQTFVAAFPKGNGGIGECTATRYDDEDEKKRVARVSREPSSAAMDWSRPVAD